MERNESTVERCDVCGLDPVVGVRRPSRIVAASRAMQGVLLQAGRFSRATAPVVILGESGTGKEVVARALHMSGPRRNAPFVAVNVAALPSELLESEVFGHAKGAFTGAGAAKVGLFEAADGGTLFLDEIAEMPLALQPKLLRVLQDGEVRRVGETRSFAVDVRLVCATHRDLADFVARGLFREDLYYRLNVLTLRVPPLRDRPEDILPLARQLLTDEGRPELSFSQAAERVLAAHTWPGNVRELANAVKHGAALATGALIDVADLPVELTRPRVPPSATAVASSTPATQTLADVERAHVLRVLEACGGSQVEAARVLGIGRNTLWRKLGRYGREAPPSS
jgi:DNA-binding NtrC family response regulator